MCLCVYTCVWVCVCLSVCVVSMWVSVDGTRDFAMSQFCLLSHTPDVATV